MFKRWIIATLAMDNDSRRKTLFVAVALCLVCSIVVSSAAVLLKPLQEANQAQNRKRIILDVAGLLETDQNIDEQFRQIETRIVDLKTGEYTDTVSAAEYDPRQAANNPALSTSLDKAEDIAGIQTWPDYMPVYLVKEGEQIKTIILPVHGYGLWSTIYGYLALQNDGNTVQGLTFYEHAETPGLGGDIDKPRWRNLWVGKKIYGPEGADGHYPLIEVVKGGVDLQQTDYQVDGLAGATLTSRGVSNMIKFWLGEQGYAPYLANLKKRLQEEAL